MLFSKFCEGRYGVRTKPRREPPPRITENDSYVNNCVMQILCRALPVGEYEKAWDCWLTWWPANRKGWFWWARAFGAFLHVKPWIIFQEPPK